MKTEILIPNRICVYCLYGPACCMDPSIFATIHCIAFIQLIASYFVNSFSLLAHFPRPFISNSSFVLYEAFCPSTCSAHFPVGRLEQIDQTSVRRAEIRRGRLQGEMGQKKKVFILLHRIAASQFIFNLSYI